jgi:hypothetical protein
MVWPPYGAASVRARLVSRKIGKGTASNQRRDATLENFKPDFEQNHT